MQDSVIFAFKAKSRQDNTKSRATSEENIMPGLLLRGGTILLHTSAQEVQAVQADVLVENDIIRKIEPSISPPNGYGIIDCSNSIVSAGFVDTHTHMWETPLKGVCENLTGLSYFATSRFLFSHVYLIVG